MTWKQLTDGELEYRHIITAARNEESGELLVVERHQHPNGVAAQYYVRKTPAQKSAKVLDELCDGGVSSEEDALGIAEDHTGLPLTE